jgi:hypothetical protein
VTTQPETAEAAVAVPEENRIAEYQGYDPDLDFRKLALEATYFTKGFRLIEKKQLVGVPHVIIGITYREGFPRSGKAGDYVSVEAVIADAATLLSLPVQSQLPPEGLRVFANEAVVYNDSGTGIRRYFTEQFHRAGIIDVGKFDEAKVASESNPFDRPYQRWASGADRATTGIVADNNGVAYRMVAMRGLRRSEYDWTPPEGGKPVPAETYYFG